MILLLALRNLAQHPKHTLLIVLLMTFLTMLFFIGNTILDTANTGLRTTYIENYTGDVVIQTRSETTLSLFGANAPTIGEFFSIPVLGNHERILALVAARSDVEAVTSQVSGPVALDAAGQRYPAIAFGIEAPGYFAMFPGIRLERGAFLRAGQRGAMISAGRARRIEAESGRPVEPGAPLLFTTAGDTGFKIREIPLVGVYSYANAGQIPNEIVLMDAQTLRALNSILLASESAAPPPREAADLLTEDVDGLFDDPGGESAPRSGESISIRELTAELRRPEEAAESQWYQGSWNFIVLRLKKGVWAPAVIDQLNRQLEPHGATAVDWRTAAGVPALLVLLFSYLFNGGLVLLIVAGIIAIVNVLLISVFQRVREIGTLRAIGASSRYIRGLILSENFFLSLAAGAAGVGIGGLLIAVLDASRLTLTNSLLISLLGREVVAIDFSLPVAGLSVLLAAALGFLASLYPIQFALKVQPVEAVAKG